MNTARRKIVLYNPRAVFFTMPLALIAIGSELDPAKYEVVIVDGRLDPDAEKTVIEHMRDAVCLGVTVLTGAPIAVAHSASATMDDPRRQARASRCARGLGWMASLHVRSRMPARAQRGRHRAGAG